LEDVEKGERKIAEKITFKNGETPANPDSLWEYIFKNSILKEKHGLPLIIDTYFFYKLKERVTDMTFLSKIKGKSFSNYLAKYIKHCKRIIFKNSSSHNMAIFSAENNLTSSVKMTRSASLKFNQSIRKTEDNRIFSNANERWDSQVKSQSVNKTEFPINIFLLTSKHLENRPCDKFEVFSGKYVKSFLIKDSQDPNNKSLPMTRNNSAITGTIHNHLIDKENVKTINTLSRSITQLKEDVRNSLSPSKLPILLSKSRSRVGSLNELYCNKSKLTLSMSKPTTSNSPVKIVLKRSSTKGIFFKKVKIISPAISCFKKEDFYYS
jgi:hypothetical protein